MGRSVFMACLAAAGALWGADKPVSIADPITEAKAMKALFGNYDVRSKASKVADDPKEFATVLASQNAVIGGKRMWLLYTWSNTEGNDCHACSVDLAGHAFELQGGAWVERGSGELGGAGSFGKPPEAKPVRWGTEAYGLLINDGYTGQGAVMTSDYLFGYDAGSFRLIFTIATMDSNLDTLAPEREKYEWEAEWKFGAPGGLGGVYDLQVNVKAGRGSPRDQESRERVPVAGAYRWDGKVFRHTVRKTVALNAER